MTANPQAARLEEIARTNARAYKPRDRKSLDATLQEIALAIIAALLLSMICC